MKRNKKVLFIVEGESAASTLRQAIFSPNYEVLALQGKLLNSAHASKAKVFSNPVCQRLFKTLGCGTEDDCDPAQLKFKQVLVLMDPDQDGIHIQALLLTLFHLYLSALVKSGRVSIIRPPWYRITEQDIRRHEYAWSDKECSEYVRTIGNQQNIVVTRLKHIGQFSTEECIEFLIDEDTRKQINLLEYQSR